MASSDASRRASPKKPKSVKSRPAKPRLQQGVDKVEIGLRLAFVLADAPGALQLGDLARAADLPPSKVHRYLVSLCRSGIIEQDPTDGSYDLGGRAIALGLAAQNHLDEFRRAESALRRLFEETQHNVAIFVWGDRGPTLIRRINSMQSIIVSSRVGSTVSVLNSAAGRVFATFLPGAVVNPAIKAEIAQGLRPTLAGREISMDEFKKLLVQTEKDGIAEVSGDHVKGFDALGAPVFDCNGQVVMAFDILAPKGTFALDRNHRLRNILRNVAAELSLKLGATGYPNSPDR